MELIFPATAPPPPIGPVAPGRAGVTELARLYAYPPLGGRPWVRANMVSSADGAATVAGRSAGLSSEGDRQVFSILRSLADVIMVGAGTARAEKYRPMTPDEAWPELRSGPAADHPDRGAHPAPGSRPGQPAAHRVPGQRPDDRADHRRRAGYRPRRR